MQNKLQLILTNNLKKSKIDIQIKTKGITSWDWATFYVYTCSLTGLKLKRHASLTTCTQSSYLLKFRNLLSNMVILTHIILINLKFVKICHKHGDLDTYHFFRQISLFYWAQKHLYDVSPSNQVKHHANYMMFHLATR